MGMMQTPVSRDFGESIVGYESVDPMKAGSRNRFTNSQFEG